VLRALQAQRREAAFAKGSPLSPWVVFADLPETPDAKDEARTVKTIRRAMIRALKVAELPAHHTPHSLRHTFCSLLIASGVSPVYVQQQAGHASVKMTVDVYGSWFAVEAPGAMDRLAVGVPSPRPGGNKTPESGNNPAEANVESLPPTGTCGRPAATRPSPG
ncbi:MAG TPA: tyrosine-type recombinase/integrase, partial [Vicinamibacteria bacterium]|nr:tyrosine-type recombinase/integrase [Vicinamibacteria bacterium]